MLVIEADERLGQGLAKKLLETASSSLFVGVQGELSNLPAQHKCIKASQANHFLGTSHQAIVYSTHDSFNANALCALCGTIEGGGVLILLTPKLDRWTHNLDEQMRSYGHDQDTCESNFIGWWQQQWQHDAVYVLQDTQPNLSQVVPLALKTEVASNEQEMTLPTNEQQHVIDGVIHAYASKENRIIKLDAPRGRGKSSTLGFLLRAFAGYEDSGAVIVSAPNKRSIASLERAAAPVFADFWALDALLEHLPKAELLIIDEAAAVPMSQISLLLLQYKLVVLASTQDGYEGSGQGYRLKLPGVIEKHGLKTKEFKLSQPMRWQALDPLEDFIRRSFLLDSKAQTKVSPIQITQASKLSFCSVTQSELANDLSLLTQVFGLLRLAHYQTTPQDLRILLDNPKHQLYLCHHKGKLVAVAWVSKEGGLVPKLAQQVALGERRIQGHLLAQILSQQAGLMEACVLHSWRVQRIVVVPDMQSCGIGSAFLEHIYQSAQQAKVDFLGASFSAAPNTLQFWLANQYKIAWLGMKADSATGLNSIQVIQSITDRAKRFEEQVRRHFFGYFQFGKDIWFKSLPISTQQIIIDHCQAQGLEELSFETEQQLLTVFAKGRAGFSGPLHLLLKHVVSNTEKARIIEAACNNTSKPLQHQIRSLAQLTLDRLS